MGRIECTQALPLPVEVERFFPKDPRLKCSKCRYKDANITTNKRSNAKPTRKELRTTKIVQKLKHNKQMMLDIKARTTRIRLQQQIPTSLNPQKAR